MKATKKNTGSKRTAGIMIEEATRARNGIAAELRAAVEAGRTAGEWFRDRVDALAYYNEMLRGLGAAL